MASQSISVPHMAIRVSPITILARPSTTQVLLVQKLLSELARDPGGGKFKDLHQQKDDQQSPMQRPLLGGAGGTWGCGVAGGSGTNP
jgi:hypothetical protein